MLISAKSVAFRAQRPQSKAHLHDREHEQADTLPFGPAQAQNALRLQEPRPKPCCRSSGIGRFDCPLTEASGQIIVKRL